MSDEKIKVSEVSQVISKDFQIAESASLIPEIDAATLEEFKIYLTEKLSELMDNKYDTLINILYRIDVSEEKLGELFSGGDRNYIPQKLAELIIDRQLQKVQFRKKYKAGEL